MRTVEVACRCGRRVVLLLRCPTICGQAALAYVFPPGWEYGDMRDARCPGCVEQQAAVEALAADAGTGPARRVKALLDGVDNERADS